MYVESQLLDICRQSTLKANGLRIAIDYDYIIEIEGRDGKHVARLNMSPHLLPEAATGLAILNDIASIGDVAEVQHVEKLDTLRFKARARIDYGETPITPNVNVAVGWDVVETSYRAFLKIVPKTRCPYALHTIMIFSVEDTRPKPIIAVTDSSRHAAALKAAGLVSKIFREEGLRATLIAVSSGRISADMVKAFSKVGIYIIVSNHHPLLSGLLSAVENKVTLILRSPDGRGLAVYTHHNRVSGAPLYIHVLVEKFA